jgi:hypothetical protein
LDLDSDVPSDTKNSWLNTNTETLGPSTFFFGGLPFPGHFRSQGIAPTRLNAETQNTEIPGIPENQDAESSTQFLFDLFLRWMHFTSLKSLEAPHRRVILAACRGLAVLTSSSGFSNLSNF